MLKTLLKKQFLELNQFYFADKKTGKLRSKKGTVLIIALYVALYIFLGVAFFGMASEIANAFFPIGFGWMYFAITGLLTVLFGVFGSVFNTFVGLYLAKDNELLISMPIPPFKILISRMAGVYAMGLMFMEIVYIPVLIAYYVSGFATVKGVVCSLVINLFLSFVVLVLSCFVGWLVALLSVKLKNKSFITVFLSLVFVAVYYVFFMNFYSFIQKLILNAEAISNGLRKFAYPVYLFGKAADGDILSLVIFGVISVALLVLTVFVMSKSFLHIATTNKGEKKKVYVEKTQKNRTVASTLLYKELKRFTSSAVYMLNCAFATILMLLASVVIFIFSGRMQEALAQIGLPAQLKGIIAVVAVLMVSSTNDITAPSISLEGKNLWIIQSMPIDFADVIRAKERLHFYLTFPPALLFAAALCFMLKVEITTAVAIIPMLVVSVRFFAAFGIMTNLLMPNLTWTNEVVPIKQGLNVLLCLLAGFVVSAIAGVGAYLLRDILEMYQYLLVVMAIFAVAVRFIDRFNISKGRKFIKNA